MKTIKTALLFVLTIGLFFGACAEKKNENTKENEMVMENQEVIKLNKPNLDRGLSVMKALNVRKSVREYGNKELELSDLSDLLWAANGINRPEEGKRTAPSALNSQDVDVYVCMKDGAYLYDAKENDLKRVSTEDLRYLLGDGQDFVKDAPAIFVLVSDLSRFSSEDAGRNLLRGAMYVGIVSQNISLFCASVGLMTVPRAMMDVEGLKKSLNLKDSQIPIMNHPVGYKK